MKKIILSTLAVLVTSYAHGSSTLPDVEYRARTDFIYIDSTKFSDLNAAIIKTTQSDETSSGGTRTLGLQHLELDLRFVQQHSELYVSIRPDASLDRGLSQDSIVREQDSRSGTSYVQSPRLKLLDLYELTLFKADSFSAKYGVRNYAYLPFEAYQGVLDFGLEVWFPRKFSSLGFQWSTRNQDIENLEQGVRDQFIFELFSLEPTDDRYEKVSSNAETADSSLVAADAHTGLAFAATYLKSKDAQFKLFTAYLDEKVDFGRKNNLMLGMNGINRHRLGSFEAASSYDFRYERESWKVSQGQYPKLEQISLALKGVLQLTPEDSIILGFSNGSSQQPLGSSFKEKEIHKGQQLDLGYRKSIYENIIFSFILSDEKRTIESAGVQTGGFEFTDSSGSNLNRMAIKLSYRLL